MQQMLIIERIEEGIAVCELEHESVRIPLELLPAGAAPGDVCLHTDEGWVIDMEETQRRRNEATDRYRKLFGRRI